jgi:hypothetical protein
LLQRERTGGQGTWHAGLEAECRIDELGRLGSLLGGNCIHQGRNGEFGVGFRIPGIEFDGLAQPLARETLDINASSQQLPALEEILVGFQRRFIWEARRACDLRHDRVGDQIGDLRLDSENILERAVIVFAPQLCTGLVEQLG